MPPTAVSLELLVVSETQPVLLPQYKTRVVPTLSLLLTHTHSLTHPWPLSYSHSPSAEPLGEVESVSDIVFSPELCGLGLVLSSGRVTFVSAASTKLEPKVRSHLNHHS